MEPRLRSDKNLVTEQSGMRVLLAGLAISFFLGYVIKSVLSPTRVAAQLEKAASHIHKDVKVTFQGAEVSFSDGVFPRFSVVIKNVQMESSQVCWMSPRLEVDELRLPISIWGALTGSSLIKKIEADNVILTLRANIKDCDRTTESNKQSSLANGDVTSEQSSSSKQLVTLSPNEQAQKYRNAIGELSIKNFKILLNEYPQYPSEFLDFAVRVKSFEPKLIEVTAKTNLLRDEQVGGYLSHANLFTEYKEVPEPQVQSHFFGNWREGHYSIIANYTIADHLLNVETDLKHIPLSQVLSLLQKYDLVSRELNGKQVWISANARMTGNAQRIKESPLEVKNFRVEGDLGEMYSEQVTFTSLEPLKYKPIGIDVKGMRVGNLLSFLGRNQTHRILGELGSFTGRAEIRSENSIHLAGEHSGLEFIFSNKGQRELQIIDRMLGDIDFTGEQWAFQVRRIEPHGGSFIGDVKLKADRDFKDVTVRARIDEMALAPQVQKLMTGGGEIGPASFNAEAHLSSGELNFLKGLLQIDNMSIEGMDFGKTRGEFDFINNEILMRTKIQDLSLEQTSAGAAIMKQVSEPSWWANGKLEMQDLQGDFHWKDLQHLRWRSAQSKLGKERRLTTEGAWNEQGLLSGSVLVRDGKNKKKYVIEGSRDVPVFNLENVSVHHMRK